MPETNQFLGDVQEDLKQIVQPFQRDLNQNQKKADLIKQCIRCAEKDDFLQLDELLKSKLAKDICEDKALEGCVPLFETLGAYADEKVEQYRMDLIEDLTRQCRDAGLEIQIDFPRFTVLKGITGEIDFTSRSTKINKKVLKSIDPRRIMAMVVRLKKQLYDTPFDPRAFIDALGKVYLELIEKENLPPGRPVPMQQFYLAYVISLQSKTFFMDMDKGKFKGYSLDQFSVDLWRYYQACLGGTSDGYELQLTPGRNKALWLLDTQGELRQITAISFHKP
ncbi:hypothetical protein [uncultured Desulfobacter sp.]|uniref:hypothetical protein n=1 Tax=uncultured Desulfobacter sp. TaxID=240139 RepID=UPI002AAAF412|nr:hypothetical protein [uncultured Desulfobacter sp.]